MSRRSLRMNILAHETMHQCQLKLTTINAEERKSDFENLIKPAVAGRPTDVSLSVCDRKVPRKPSNFICLVKFVSPSALDCGALARE